MFVSVHVGKEMGVSLVLTSQLRRLCDEFVWLGDSCVSLLQQKSTSQLIQSGQRKDVLFVDGLKIGRIIKLLYATGVCLYFLCSKFLYFR